MAQAESEAIKMRRCPGCNLDLPTKAFYGEEGVCGGLSSKCRECMKTYNRLYGAARKEHPVITRPYELRRYKQKGSVRLADDMPEARIAHFFADTHSREFLIDLCVEMGIVEEAG